MSAGDGAVVLAWERREDPTGELIPMAVRMKLDLAGRKIRLHEWQALRPEDRTRLRTAPCAEDAEILDWERALVAAAARAGIAEPARLAVAADGADAFAWRDARAPMPDAVGAMSRECGRVLDWSGLSRFARFVLYRAAAKGDRSRFLESLEELTPVASEGAGG